MNNIITIIVTYNGMQWIERCINSVLQSDLQTDIYVIDNGSTDETVQFILSNYKEIKLFISPLNLGFGGANNIGLKYALENGYKYVYLLNQDAWIKPDTLLKLTTIASNNPEYGILSPLQINAEESKLDNNFHSSCSRDLFSDIIFKCRLHDIYPTDFVMAAHWLITQQCLETVGLFSPTFFHYGEDNNYIDRAKFYGFKVGIVPSAFGIHDREYRLLTPQKQDYLFYSSNLIKLSNPNIKTSLSSTIVRYLYRIVVHRNFRCFRYLNKTIRHMSQINRNRKISKSPGAFN